MNTIVNELSNTIDLESTLIRAEALFRRFQRMVEAIDKKSNFPAPQLRHRQLTSNHSASSASPIQSQSSPLSPTSPKSPVVKANTTGTDTVSVSVTNSGATSSGSTSGPRMTGDGKKGKKKDDDQTSETAQQSPRPKVISPELRELLSTKVEILPRKVVRKEGEGRSSLGR